MNKPVIAIASSLLAFACLTQASSAQEAIVRVGVVAPTEGSLAILGNQIRSGFDIFTQQYGADNVRFEVVEESETCDADGGEDAAFAMEEADVDVVVGFLCVESLVTALPILKQSNIPVINLNIQSDIVREEAARLGQPLFSLAPRASDQAKYASQYIIQNWGDKSVALIEDGTISNRELVDSIRIQLDDGGFQPIVLDNFRPGQDKQFSLVRRLAQADISHVFAGASRSDVAIIARDASSIDVEFTLAGGDVLRAADDGLELPEGAISILADINMEGLDAEAARLAFDNAEVFPDRFPLLSYAIAQIIDQIGENEELPPTEALIGITYETVIGPITFDKFGERQESVFKAMIWQDGHFVVEAETQ